MMDSDAEQAQHSLGLYLKGAAFGLSAVLIWGGWLAYTRLGVSGTLEPSDLTALRFLVAGLVLLPLVIKKGLLLDQLGWGKLGLLMCGAGAPYVLLMSQGLAFAPAADAGAMFAGLMPVNVAIISALLMGEKFSWAKKIGFGCIFLSVLILVSKTLSLGEITRLTGQGFFACAAFFWAVFTVILRSQKIAPLHATALVAVGSMLGYLPIYFWEAGLRVLDAPALEIVTHGFYQGIMTSIVALVLFGRAVSLLGASSGAAFAALLPVTTALIAIPVMGETPSPSEWLLFVAVSIGVYLASGGPLGRSKS